MKVFGVLIFLMGLVSADSVLAKSHRDVLLSFKEIKKMEPSVRNRYMKSVGRTLAGIKTRKGQTTFLFNFFPQAHAATYRCIGGGIPIVGGPEANCGTSSFAGFSCSSGQEICNPYVFGVQNSGEPLCFDNATTQTCFEESSPGSTTTLDPVFAKQGAHTDFLRFRRNLERICSGQASTAETVYSIDRACETLKRQVDVNRERDLEGQSGVSLNYSGASIPSGHPTSSVDDADPRDELSGGSPAPVTGTLTHNVSIPTSYFQGGSSEGIREFNELYNKFSGNPKLARSQTALQRALAFYAKNKNGIPASCGGTRSGAAITNKDYILVTDYTLPHTEDRMFILNVKTGEVISTPAAHGYGSNRPISECPREHRINCGSRGTKCSIPVNPGNRDGRGQTSRGFFLTAEPYRSTQSTFQQGSPLSRRGVNAIRMDGLISDNSLARPRSIVFHRASYVTESSVNNCSSSAGCPSIAPSVFEDIKDAVDRGALMYLHTVEDEQKDEPDC